MKKLLSSYERLAKIYGKQSGVQVIVRGSGFETDFRTIVIADIPEELNSQLRDPTLAGLLHECLHIENTKHFTIEEAMKIPMMVKFPGLQNNLEDCRILEIGKEKYLGMISLQKAGLTFIRNIIVEAMRDKSIPIDMSGLLGGCICYRLSGEDYSFFPQGIIEMTEMTKDLWENVKWDKSRNGTMQSIDLAEKIVNRLQLKSQQEQQQQAPQSKNNKRENGEEKDQESSGLPSQQEYENREEDQGNKEENNEEEQEKEGEGKDQESKDKGDNQEEENKEDYDEKGDGGKDDENEEEDQEQDTNSNSDDKDNEEKSVEEEIEKMLKDADQLEIDTIDLRNKGKALTDMFREMEANITKVIDDTNRRTYATKHIPHPEALKNDKIIELSKLTEEERTNQGYPREASLSFSSRIEEIGVQAKRLKAKILPLLIAENRSSFLYEQDEGIIDDSKLYKIRKGNGKIYKRTVSGKKTNTAVTLLCDVSGSMCGDKIEILKFTLTIIADSLFALKIPFEILTFTTGERDYSTKKEKNGIFYNRLEATEHTIVKAFNENFLSVRSLIGLIIARSANADNESILWGAKRLAERKEIRKIMLVLSDGHPSACEDSYLMHDDLIKNVKIIENDRIEVVGIGITDNAVRKFYPTNTVINTIEEVPREIYQVLLKKLREGNSRRD